MQANSQKTYKITITSNRWMWSLESASVTIQNPQTGNSLTFDKWHKMDKLRTPGEWDIIAPNAVVVDQDKTKNVTNNY